MKNTCSQKGICQFCGEEIERFIKTQPWYLKDTVDDSCADSPNRRHILLGVVRRKND